MTFTRRRLLGLFAVVALVAIGLGVFVWWQTSADMLSTMMTENYGLYDAGKQVWRGAQGKEANRNYTICAEKDIDVRGERHLLLAVCGSTAETDSHATRGSVDLYVLKGDRRKFTLAAQTADIESGAWGQSGSVSAMKLGSSFYGFAIDEGWSGQGFTFGTTTLYVPKDDALQEALTLRTSLDNGGTQACADNKMACNNLERKLDVDESDPALAVYPLIVTQSGRHDGHSMTGRFKLSFDKKRWSYVAPKGLDLMPE